MRGGRLPPALQLWRRPAATDPTRSVRWARRAPGRLCERRSPTCAARRCVQDRDRVDGASPGFLHGGRRRRHRRSARSRSHGGRRSGRGRPYGDLRTGRGDCLSSDHRSGRGDCLSSDHRSGRGDCPYGGRPMGPVDRLPRLRTGPRNPADRWSAGARCRHQSGCFARCRCYPVGPARRDPSPVGCLRPQLSALRFWTLRLETLRRGALDPRARRHRGALRSSSAGRPETISAGRTIGRFFLPGCHRHGRRSRWGAQSCQLLAPSCCLRVPTCHPCVGRLRMNPLRSCGSRGPNPRRSEATPSAKTSRSDWFGCARSAELRSASSLPRKSASHPRNGQSPRYGAHRPRPMSLRRPACRCCAWVDRVQA